jgi:hypothetical protein
MILHGKAPSRGVNRAPYRAIVVSFALLGAGIASVSPADATVPVQAVGAIQQAPMIAHTVVSVAQSGSGTQITLEDGKRLTLTARQYSTWKRVQAATRPSANPNTTVNIPCGYEFLSFQAIGNSKGRILTTWLNTTTSFDLRSRRYA